jgi:beta-lactamase superfamily II metal-dependent hydrolase
MSTFQLTMHPARDGDCLVLTWGDAKLHHLVVDLGRTATYGAVRPVLSQLGDVELFVISHIDADHIAGAMPLLREQTPPLRPKRVWFNAREHLVAAQNRAQAIEPFGARQGDKFSKGIVALQWPWNAEFASEIVSTDSPEAAAPIELAGGLSIRLLSPTDAALAALLDEWPATVEEAAARPGDPDPSEQPETGPDVGWERFGGPPDVAKLAGEPYQADDTPPNGSSIAFVAEFDNKRVLFGADAHAEVLVPALLPLAASDGGRYRIDLVKISHHGSRANTSSDLLDLIDCTRFAFSTYGGKHGHPHPQTVARLLAADPHRDKTLYFNYRQPNSEVWESVALGSTWRYHCEMPDASGDAIGSGTWTIEI